MCNTYFEKQFILYFEKLDSTNIFIFIDFYVTSVPFEMVHTENLVHISGAVVLFVPVLIYCLTKKLYSL